VYALLAFVLEDCWKEGITPLVGGDINACIGIPLAGDDVFCLGTSGLGHRNRRGKRLVEWILENNFCTLNRQAEESRGQDLWTCRRALDGCVTQLDYIFTDSSGRPLRTWCDHCIGVGLDHRCVHSVVEFVLRGGRKKEIVKKNFKGWRPKLDVNGDPAAYHSVLRDRLQRSGTDNFGQLESAMAAAGKKTGRAQKKQVRFTPSPDLVALRKRRRRTQDPAEIETSSFEIRCMQRQGIRNGHRSA